MTTWGKNGRRAMPRRTLLRGMFRGSVITLGLPTLDAMLNSNGTAYAQTGTPTGAYFGTFHWAHGMYRSLFFPKGTEGDGSKWSLNEQMAPLENFKEYLSIASNLRLFGTMSGHGTCMVPLQCGAPMVGTQKLVLVKNKMGNDVIMFGALNDAIGPRETIDQEVLREFAKVRPGEPKKSLVVGICPGSAVGRGPLTSTLSYRGYDDYIPPTYNPRDVFNDLFGSFFPTSPAGMKEDPRIAIWPNLIDIVKRDLDTLKKEVGPQDRMRLDSHLADMGRLQEAIKAPPPPATCTRPGEPAAIGGNEAGRDEALNERVNGLMANIVAMGLSCGQRRVFTYNFVNDAAATPWANHGDSHNDAAFEDPPNSSSNPPATAEQLRQTRTHNQVVNVMRRLAVLLEALRSKDAGGGKNLLDKAVIMCYSDMRNGGHHGYSLPMFLAGKR